MYQDGVAKALSEAEGASIEVAVTIETCTAVGHDRDDDHTYIIQEYQWREGKSAEEAYCGRQSEYQAKG